MKTAGYRVVKSGAYRAMPWRNGRGTTLEIGRAPAAAEPFLWRLSLARIEEDGDFSAYPGYRRALVLISGKSLRLRFRGQGECQLGPTKRTARFEGDWITRGTIGAGPCTDLSLIVRKGAPAQRAAIVRAPRVWTLKKARSITLSPELHGAIFVLEGSISVRAAGGARTRVLASLDTLLLDPGPTRTLTLRNRGTTPARLALLRWRAGDAHHDTAQRKP